MGHYEVESWTDKDFGNLIRKTDRKNGTGINPMLAGVMGDAGNSTRMREPHNKALPIRGVVPHRVLLYNEARGTLTE